MTGVAVLKVPVPREAPAVDWRALIEAVPHPVVVSNETGKIVYVNGAVEPVFGHKPETLLGRPVETLLPNHLQALPPSRDAEHRLRHADRGAARRAIRADGSEFPVAISLGSSQAPAGDLVITVIEDLSELHARDRAIEYMHERMARNAKLEEVNRELEAFSFSVSHDLRLPLRIVDGFSQILVEDYASKLDDYGRDCIDRVRQAAQRMGQLIDDLLELSRITRSDLIATDVGLGRMAREIADTLTASNADREVECRIDETMTARGDPSLLRIALENLLSNAWKFTAGRSPARIEVGQCNLNGINTFYVHDNGVGFDMAFSDKLFGAFQRMHSEKEFPGTGIGLATVQRIVNRHRGRIWGDAKLDQGATFYFTLFEGGADAIDNHFAG